MSERLLSSQEVAVLVGCYITTLSKWYEWKRLHPDHELAKLLPDYIQSAERQKRLWRQEDVYKLIQFKQSIPKGKNGIMGDVTQKYVKKGKRSQNGKKKSGSSKRRNKRGSTGKTQ